MLLFKSIAGAIVPYSAPLWHTIQAPAGSMAVPRQAGILRPETKANTKTTKSTKDTKKDKEKKTTSEKQKKGSHPKSVVGQCSGHVSQRETRLSLEASGKMTSRRPSRWKTARAVWHHRGARVARQRCPILREGGRSRPAPAGGPKALNARLLCGGTTIRFTTFSG